MSADETTAPAVISADQQRLHELGYAQELRRHMSGFNNFAVSFTIMGSPTELAAIEAELESLA